MPVLAKRDGGDDREELLRVLRRALIYDAGLGALVLVLGVATGLVTLFAWAAPLIGAIWVALLFYVALPLAFVSGGLPLLMPHLGGVVRLSVEGIRAVRTGRLRLRSLALVLAAYAGPTALLSVGLALGAYAPDWRREEEGAQALRSLAVLVHACSYAFSAFLLWRRRPSVLGLAACVGVGPTVAAIAGLASGVGTVRREVYAARQHADLVSRIERVSVAAAPPGRWRDSEFCQELTLDAQGLPYDGPSGPSRLERHVRGRVRQGQTAQDPEVQIKGRVPGGEKYALCWTPSRPWGWRWPVTMEAIFDYSLKAYSLKEDMGLRSHNRSLGSFDIPAPPHPIASALVFNHTVTADIFVGFDRAGEYEIVAEGESVRGDARILPPNRIQVAALVATDNDPLEGPLDRWIESGPFDRLVPASAPRVLVGSQLRYWLRCAWEEPGVRNARVWVYEARTGRTMARHPRGIGERPAVWP